MHSFKDTNGKVWTLEVTVASVRRVKALSGVDLLALVKDRFGPLGDLVGDPCRLADVLWCLVQPQAEAAKLTDEDFGRALAGDAIAAAAEAFVEAYIDFFPERRSRENLRKALAKARQAADLLQDRASKEVEKLDPEALARTLSESCGTVRESSASTRGLAPWPSSS